MERKYINFIYYKNFDDYIKNNELIRKYNRLTYYINDTHLIDFHNFVYDYSNFYFYDMNLKVISNSKYIIYLNDTTKKNWYLNYKLYLNNKIRQSNYRYTKHY